MSDVIDGSSIYELMPNSYATLFFKIIFGLCCFVYHINEKLLKFNITYTCYCELQNSLQSKIWSSLEVGPLKDCWIRTIMGLAY